MKSIILGVLFVATVAIAFPSQLTYNIGDEYDYTCSALVDSRGQMADGSRTSGSYSTLNGIVAVQVSLNNKLHWNLKLFSNIRYACHYQFRCICNYFNALLF